MTSLWVKIRDAIESECETLQNLLAPLEAQLKPVAESDLKDIAAAAATAGVAAVTSGGSLGLTAIETALVVAGRAAVTTAAAKGIALTEQAGLGVAALAVPPATVEPVSAPSTQAETTTLAGSST